MSKKIVFYTMAMNKGGSERVIANLSNYLIQKKYDVYIVCNLFGKSYYELDNRIKYITLDQKSTENRMIQIFRKFWITRSNKLKLLLEDICPDVIIAFLPEPSLRSLQIKKYKTIVSERCDPNVEFSNPILKMAMKLLYKRADGFIFQTEVAKKYYEKIITCNYQIIPNPINSKFTEKNYKGKNSKSIVNVGRLSNQKNQLMLIKAFSIFCKEYPEYILKIYGDGPLKDKLKKCVDELGINEKVKFMGVVDNLEDKLCNDKIFVLSSNYEGMPNALMEAMALGLPSISTDCPVGGPKILIKNYENGILIPINDIEALVSTLKELINDDELCNKLSKNAMNSLKNYYPEKINTEWETYIKKVIYNKK